LGATVCVPGEPTCSRCPITTFCRTRGRGESQNRKPRQTKASISVALATKGECVLLVQRNSGESLMSEMWELPKLNYSIRDDEVLFRVRHSITITDYLVSVVGQSGIATKNGEWIHRGKAHRLPLTGLTKKILRKANIIQ
jgi:A/G-specific adenine glycosylase